jgi:hypothetical protein
MVSNLKYLDIIEVKIKWSLPFKHWRYRTTIIYLLWFLIIPFLYFLSYGSRELDRGACTWWGLQPCNEDMDLSKFQEKGSKFKFFSHTDCEMNGSNSSFFFENWMQIIQLWLEDSWSYFQSQSTSHSRLCRRLHYLLYMRMSLILELLGDSASRIRF